MLAVGTVVLKDDQYSVILSSVMKCSPKKKAFTSNKNIIQLLEAVDHDSNKSQVGSSSRDVQWSSNTAREKETDEDELAVASEDEAEAVKYYLDDDNFAVNCFLSLDIFLMATCTVLNFPQNSAECLRLAMESLAYLSLNYQTKRFLASKKVLVIEL